MIYMQMYVLQVKPGYEESAARMLNHKGYTAICPTEEMHIRHGGQWHRQLKLVFTQYIFVECELSDDDYYRIKSVCGVMRFLGHGKPEALLEHEKAYIYWLHNSGKPIEASKVYTTSAGDKIVLSGILKTYQDDMINLDLRQRRAKINVPFCGKSHTVTIPVIGI